jgi:hypothetical protein
MMMRRWAVLFAGLAVCTAFATPLFEGQDGLVVIEAESSSSARGQWREQTSVDGYTGDGHLEFTGNKPASGPPKSPLVYLFTVDRDGIYRLLIRAHKRLEDQEPDKCNDCWVRLEGDFESGGDAPLNMLKEDTKLYGGSAAGWGWTAKLDKGHKKYQPLYRLKAGETYTLIISGRSQRFNMDRIIFKHESVSNQPAQDPKQPESREAKRKQRPEQP